MSVGEHKKVQGQKPKRREKTKREERNEQNKT